MVSVAMRMVAKSKYILRSDSLAASSTQGATLRLLGTWSPSADCDDADGCNHAARSWSEACDDALGCSHDAGLWTLDVGATVGLALFDLLLRCSLPFPWAVDPEDVDTGRWTSAECDDALGCNHEGSALEIVASLFVALGCNHLDPRTCREDVAALAVGLGWSHDIAWPLGIVKWS